MTTNTTWTGTLEVHFGDGRNQNFPVNGTKHAYYLLRKIYSNGRNGLYTRAVLSFSDTPENRIRYSYEDVCGSDRMGKYNMLMDRNNKHFGR